MSNFKFRKVISFILAFALVLGMTSLASFAAPSPLFEMNGAKTRQGEEFEITIKFARNITTILDPVAALDVSLCFDSSIYSVVSMENGKGLNNALSKLDSSGDANLERNYIFSTSSNIPGEVKWSMVTLSSFTFVKGEEFMKIRFKANDLSDLTKNANMTIKVTSAAAPGSLENITDKFSSYTNSMDVEVNLTTLCDWEYVAALGGYRLVKFNGANAEVFTIPQEYDAPNDLRGACPVVSIGSGAFRDCTTLKKVVLDKNVREVGTAAFMYCEGLERIVVYSETTKFGANSLYGTSDDFVVRCVKGSVADTYAQNNSINVEYFENIKDGSYTGTDEKVYFTGSPVELSNFRVYDSKNRLLKLGEDYVVYYSDNVEVGTAKIIITGRGEYLGSKEASFQILCPYHTDGNEYYTEKAIYTDCEKDGVIVKNCTFCEFHDESTVASAKEHGETTDVVKTEATCTTKGVMAKVCNDCEKVLSTSEIETKPHNNPENGVWVIVTPAACEVKGKEVKYCADCETVVEEREIPALVHTYQMGIIVEPTCQDTGLEGIMCIYCKESHDSLPTVLPVVDHDYQWCVTTEPTCKDKGVETKECRFCGLAESDPAETREVPAKGCTGGEWVVTKDATCEAPGVKLQYCVVCEEMCNSDVIPALGHNEEWIEVTIETCTTGLHKIKRCTTCNEELEVIKNTAPGHKPGEWKTVTELTCTQDGLKERYCTVCNELCDTDEKKHEGHKSGEWKTTPATCAKEGSRDHYCSVCNEVYESNPIERLAHTAGGWEVVVEPNCTQEGLRHRVCTVCGDAVQTETIEANGHTLVRTTVTLPTYRFEGQDQVACGVCGEFIRYIPTRKLNPDIDGDGNTKSSDALKVLQHATGLKKLDGDALKNADLDGSGAVNSADALIILQIATGLVTA